MALTFTAETGQLTVPGTCMGVNMSQSALRMVGLWVAAFLPAFLLGGCTTSPPRLSVDVETCCEAQFERYATYEVVTTNVPGFLEPYLLNGIRPVLSRKGLDSTVDDPDLSVRMQFNQVYLNEESGEDEYFGPGIDPGIATRFMAAVSVDVFDTDNEHIVWSGRLSRIHVDPHGQPRGNDHKMQGIIDGFEELFADYPMRLIMIKPEN